MQFTKTAVRDHLMAQGLVVVSMKHSYAAGVGDCILAKTVVPGMHECARKLHVVTPADLGIEIKEKNDG